MTDTATADALPEDPSAIERLRKWGGDKLVREMTELFVRDVPVRLRTAWNALSEGDWKTLERNAHALKSSCAQLGAPHMQALARELEQCAARQASDDSADLIDRLDRAFTRHTEWLREHQTETAA